MVYASFGQGVESEVAPGRSRYTNAGEALPALTSKQFEIGVKGELAQLRWGAACLTSPAPCLATWAAAAKRPPARAKRMARAKHSGLELTAATPTASAAQPWHVDGGITIINAKRQGSTIDASQNGLRPTNVPDWILRLNAAYKIAAVAWIKP